MILFHVAVKGCINEKLYYYDRKINCITLSLRSRTRIG